MAHVVMLKHPRSGLVRKGFYGFSWTTLFFGGFPALFRGDFIVGLVFIVLPFFTAGLSSLIMAFLYNRHFTTKLIEQGYEFADSEGANAMARARLGVVQSG